MSQTECLNCSNKYTYDENEEMPELCEKCKDLWECDNCGTYVNEEDINECRECGDYFCEACMESHDGRFDDESNYGKCDECGEQLPVAKEDHLYCDECQKFFDGEDE